MALMLAWYTFLCMKLGKRLALVLLIVTMVLAASCAGPIGNSSSGGNTEGGRSGIAASVASAPEATVGVADTAPVSEPTSLTSDIEGTTMAVREAAPAPSPSRRPFAARTEESGGNGLLADGILTVRYGVHDGYERVVVDLGTGKEPAGRVPDWSLTSPTGDGLLRVKFPSVSATSVSDGMLRGPLLKDFHVARGSEGGMFVDVFAEKAFTYRVLELEDPARLAVDFKSSGMPLGMPLPSEGGKTVLVEPRRGARIDGAFTVSGYSRNLEATNTVVLTNSDGKTVARKTVQSSDWSSTWGYFETTIEAPPSFSGAGKLSAGAEGARDGSFEGVEIPVRGR